MADERLDAGDPLLRDAGQRRPGGRRRRDRGGEQGRGVRPAGRRPRRRLHDGLARATRTARRSTPRASSTRTSSPRGSTAWSSRSTTSGRCIFNLHVPPYDSSLDTAPALTDDLEVVMSGSAPKMIPVGSTAVRSVDRAPPADAVAPRPRPREPGGDPDRPHAGDQPGSDYHTGRINGCLIQLARRRRPPPVRDRDDGERFAAPPRGRGARPDRRRRRRGPHRPPDGRHGHPPAARRPVSRVPGAHLRGPRRPHPHARTRAGSSAWPPRAAGSRAVEFNALNGARRMLFHDPDSAAQVDVFVDTFEMCHRLPLADGLDRAGPLSLWRRTW